LNTIKAFLNNIVVQIVAWVLLVLSSLVLILAGVSADAIAKIPLMVVGIVDAVAILIVAIKNLLQKKDTATK
jgi:hypothetical protein